MSFNYGDKIYYVTEINGYEDEIEGYIIEKIDSDTYKILQRQSILKNNNSYTYTFVKENNITPIFPDYWDELDNILKK